MQIEVMSLRGSQWLQLFLEQAQIGQMVEHWCKEHPVACSTYYHWKKALREEFLARMEAEQGHPILPTAVTVLFNQSEGCLRLLSATGLPSTKQFAHWHLFLQIHNSFRFFLFKHHLFVFFCRKISFFCRNFS